MEKKFGSLSSSIDPQKMSIRAQSIILGASSLIIMAAALLGHTISQDQITTFAANTAITVSTLGTAVSVIGYVFGKIRSLVTKRYQ